MFQMQDMSRVKSISFWCYCYERQSYGASLYCFVTAYDIRSFSRYTILKKKNGTYNIFETRRVCPYENKSGRILLGDDKQASIRFQCAATGILIALPCIYTHS